MSWKASKVWVLTTQSSGLQEQPEEKNSSGSQNEGHEYILTKASSGGGSGIGVPGPSGVASSVKVCVNPSNASLAHPAPLVPVVHAAAAASTSGQQPPDLGLCKVTVTTATPPSTCNVVFKAPLPPTAQQGQGGQQQPSRYEGSSSEVVVLRNLPSDVSCVPIRTIVSSSTTPVVAADDATSQLIRQAAASLPASTTLSPAVIVPQLPKALPDGDHLLRRPQESNLSITSLSPLVIPTSVVSYQAPHLSTTSLSITPTTVVVKEPLLATRLNSISLPTTPLKPSVQTPQPATDLKHQLPSPLSDSTTLLMPPPPPPPPLRQDKLYQRLLSQQHRLPCKKTATTTPQPQAVARHPATSKSTGNAAVASTTASQGSRGEGPLQEAAEASGRTEIGKRNHGLFYHLHRHSLFK